MIPTFDRYWRTLTRRRGGTMRDRIWHRLYCSWYEHCYAGHRVRAAVWGKVADMVCR